MSEPVVHVRIADIEAEPLTILERLDGFTAAAGHQLHLAPAAELCGVLLSQLVSLKRQCEAQIEHTRGDYQRGYDAGYADALVGRLRRSGL